MARKFIKFLFFIIISQPPVTSAESIIEFEKNADDIIPKLDVSLFTSAPVLDKEPWRPINPSPSQIKPTLAPEAVTTTLSHISKLSEIQPIPRNPFNPPIETIMYRNKFKEPESILALNDRMNSSVYYQSFTNPDFSAGDLAIEKLGVADLKPYPLPVNKIDLTENVPDFKFLSPTANENENLSDEVKMSYDEEKFEHLGGGVIAKKPESSTESSSISMHTIDQYPSVLPEKDDPEFEIDLEAMQLITTEPPTKIGDIFLELLNMENNLTKTNNSYSLSESRLSPDDLEDVSAFTTERLSFFNIKDYVMMQKNKTEERDDELTLVDKPNYNSSESNEFSLVSSTNMFTTTQKPTTAYVEIETVKYTPLGKSLF